MSVLIATVGGSESVVKLGFRMMENVEKVILVPGKPLEKVMDKSEIKPGKKIADPIQKAEELKELLKGFGLEVEIEDVNPFDFRECLLKIIELIQKQPEGTDISVNVTGGTKPLSLAAMNAACMCHYCKAFYIQEKGSGDIKVDLPISSPGYFKDIGDQAKKILSYLLENQKRLKKPVDECSDDELRNFTTKNIALGLGVTSQTITNKLQMMEADGLILSRKGAVKRSKSEKNPSGIGKSSVKFCWLTDEGRIYATYFSNSKT